MNKVVKRILIALLILVILFVLFLVAWVFVLFPFFDPNRDAIDETPMGPVEIAEEYESIDFNEEEGLLYVNNEMVVFTVQGTPKDEVAELAETFKAQLDDSMADIDMYRFIFAEAMTYEDLMLTQKRLEANDIVESLYLNLVSEYEVDTVDSEEEEFDYQEPAFPDDNWDDENWNVDVPRGKNWGMEAINAPGAWGYLDQISEVNVGLIDSMPNINHEDLTFDSNGVQCLFVDVNTGLTNTNRYSLTAQNHGSHVAGTIDAEWDNGVGVAGAMGGKGNLHYSAVYYDSNGTLSSRYATAYSYMLSLKTLIEQDVQAINISQNTSRLIGFAASHGNENAINYLTQQAELAQKALSRLIEARNAAGDPDFVICVAAGNSNNLEYYKDDDMPYGYRDEMTDWECVKYLFGWRGESGNSLALYNNFLNLMSTPEVKDRLICVGAVQIDQGRSTSSSTIYAYTAFSNVGSRVDIVAPGYDIYSCYANGSYDYMSGTSMATPHVTGVAGLLFGCNPELTGPEVKSILVSSTKGRYNYYGGYSGLLDAEMAVVNALQTREEAVERVLRTQTSDGLDLCFVVDTTGSMGDDIDNAQDNMEEILSSLAEKTLNYRVALIDYRDFSSRTGDSSDYPSSVQLRFTDNEEDIIAAINGLDLGYGGDSEETVYSGLREAIRLDWRANAKKVIIILGDAPPLDPEPETGLTYDEILLDLYNADISLDYDDSDDRVVGEIDDCLINVFSIGTDASSDAEDFFEKISESTGGSYAGVDDASEVGDAIIDSIEQIEIDTSVTVTADFSDSLSSKTIDLYKEGEYVFSFETNEEGKFVIEDIDPETYHWECNEMYAGGTLIIEESDRITSAANSQEYWFTPVQLYWQQHKGLVFLYAACAIAFCILLPVILAGIRKAVLKRRGSTTHKSSDSASKTTCPHCNAPINMDAKFCSVCGKPCQAAHSHEKTARNMTCPGCGRACGKNEVFCIKCGTKIDE